MILLFRFQVCSYQIGVFTNLRFAQINPLNRQTRSGMLRNINKISLIVSLSSWLNLSLLYLPLILSFLFSNLRQFLTFAFSFIKGIFGCLLKHIQPRQVAPFCAQMLFLSHHFSPYTILSSLAEGQGPTEVEAKTDVSERAFKPMPFLSKFWEIQVGRHFLSVCPRSTPGVNDMFLPRSVFRGGFPRRVPIFFQTLKKNLPCC